ncbi:MAG TPA: hypothetical protein PLA97_11345 [Rubrivivax sp.]|nr:hypothetical protein [Rubrivivax sp.]
MSAELQARVSKSWFSNYEPELALEVCCGVCGNWNQVRVAWQQLLPGTGGLILKAAAQQSPFLLQRYARLSCNCGARMVLALTGAAGGRQGEEQYGIAALQTGDIVFG